MSGAEILFGIGILCNAMQIITFGRDALQVCRHIRDGGTPDPKFHSYINDATKSYIEMNESLVRSKPLSREQQQIVDISELAHKNLEDLQHAFDQLAVSQSSRRGLRGKFRVVKSGVKTLLRAKDIESLQKTFDGYERLLQTDLLCRICSQGDATRLLQDATFRDFKTSLQYVITQLSKGNQNLSAILSQQAVEASKQAEEQHSRTQRVIGQYLYTTEENLKSYIAQATTPVRNINEHRLKNHDQLLASLRYPEMNSRKNQIHAQHHKTLPWLFENREIPKSGLEKMESETALHYQPGDTY
ncbi:hypothetical protein FBEOM_4126 [Fusarium beomiforme]|uniref:Fungal N-terminal domain-containing protein n=1 Tax=Fusarium beomiforme TaxID=44412 RepID=A0A9P5ANI6_9HYPO|nr:hypothetical protein FBEOM_4126 [Fusarium beomiforme]